MDISWDSGIIGTIGRTPLIPLSKLFPRSEQSIAVYAKLELMNPTGSAKDRPAWRMLRQAWVQGRIGPGSVIVESSSGNMAISLAAICSYLGMRFISVIDPRTTAHNIRIMQAYGADVSFVAEPDPETGEFLPARLKRVQQLLTDLPGSFWPNQYGNEHNVMAHYEGTMPEIASVLSQVDYVIGGVSTCGTMLGCARYIQERGLPTKVVAVDAVGSVILGGAKGPRLFPGLGAGIVPPFGQSRFMDEAVQVSDWDMAVGCRRLVREESILAGPSSGAVISALSAMIDRLPSDSVCVAIIHDRGDRYMDTVYNDNWIREKFDADISSSV